MRPALLRLRRIPPLAWIAALGTATLAPGLGAFGFWDPGELDTIESARGASYPLPAAAPALVSLALRTLGPGEAALRAPFVLTALASLLAVAWAGAGLFGRRAGLLAALVLGTTPLFLLQARQLTSQMPLVLALSLSLGGLARWAWPLAKTPLRGRLLSLGLGVLGLGLGVLSGGVALGLLLPLATLAATIPLTTRPPVTRTRLAIPAAAAFAIALFTLTRPLIAGQFSWLLAGVARAGAPPERFEVVIRQLGFGLFPWGALAFFALGKPLAALETSATTTRRVAGQLYLLVFAAFGVALTTGQTLLAGVQPFAVLAPLALALGVLLDDLLDGRTPGALVGALAAVGTMLVARDVSLTPATLFSVHLPGPLTWPPIAIGPLVLATGALFSASLLLACIEPARGQIGGLWRVLAWAGPRGAWAACAAAGIFAVALLHGLVPALSRHLSLKPQLGAFTRSAGPDDVLYHHRLGRTRGALGALPAQEVPAEAELVALLGRPTRTFAIVPTTVLAPLDQALRTAGVPYFALEASSRHLLLSNRLGPAGIDRNPLATQVWLPPPGADARPPWPPPRNALHCVIDGTVALVGADHPSSLRRPGRLPLTLHFRVLARPRPGHGIFVHLDGEARVNGDHQPLGGALPTAHWVPGTLLRDHHEIEVPLMTTPAGRYRIAAGLWPGGNRPGLPITAGDSDSPGRCRVGSVVVR